MMFFMNTVEPAPMNAIFGLAVMDGNLREGI